MAQLFETLCMMLAFKESHSLAMHYCRLVWDVRSLSNLIYHFWHRTVLMVYKGWIEDHKRTSLEDIIKFTNDLILNGIKIFI